MPLLPTTPGVAIGWLKTLALPGVASKLPKLEAWPVYNGTIRGFVTVDVVGTAGRASNTGATARDTPMRTPILSVGTWAAVPNSDNPQVGAANQLAEVIVDAVYASPFPPVRLRQSASYDYALVQSAGLISEPREVQDPDASVAHFITEISLYWTRQA